MARTELLGCVVNKKSSRLGQPLCHQLLDQLAAMAPCLDEIIGHLVSLFHMYAGRDGDKNTLTKGELRKLTEKGFPGVLVSSLLQPRLPPLVHSLPNPSIA